MTKIQTLSKDLRNKISAGEVVERPASVVKELMENSLDAGASEITVVVEKGGQQLIQVTDNGSGINSVDIPKAIERYSTSKIKKLDDLFTIDTFGFRGEALASVASVSELDIASCQEGKEGAEVKVQNGECSEIRPAPRVRGTQITVHNLFYNTPARRKFMKSPRIELRQIIQTIRWMALSHPEVNIILSADEKEVVNVQPESLEERIASLFDPTYQENLLSVQLQKGDYSFSGFIGNLNLVRSRPGDQYIFLNRRYIKNRLLNSAVYSGYQSLTKRGEFPFFVLNLVIPPDQIDVNVHPMKIEVRFKDEWRVYHVLKSGITDSLSDVLETIPYFEKMTGGFNVKEPSISTSGVGSVKQEIFPFNRHIPGPVQSSAQLERAKSYASELATRQESSSRIDVENIWQVHKKYVVSEISRGLVIIDQHVAHERILFEEAMNTFNIGTMASQALLFPESLDFSPDEYSVLLEVLPFLEKIGFRMKETGKYKVELEAIPSEMGWGNERRVIKDIIDHYLSHQNEYSSMQENLAASFACHAAVKAGDTLSKDEMQELVNRLFGTKHPYYCPHGRPIIVQLSLDELDKRFERE